MHKKFAPFILIFFIASYFISGINLAATVVDAIPQEDIKKTSEEEKSDELMLFQVEEDFELEDVPFLIHKGMVFFGTITEDSVEISFGNSSVKLPKDKVDIVKEHDLLPIETDENFQTQIITKGAVLTQNPIDETYEKGSTKSITVKESLEIPIMTNENLDLNMEMLFGNVINHFVDSTKADNNEETINEEEKTVPPEVSKDQERDDNEHIESDRESEQNQSDILPQESSEEETSVTETELDSNAEENSFIKQSTDKESNKLVLEENEKEIDEKRSHNIALSSFRAVDLWQGVNTKYFEVTQDKLEVYDNRSGSLKLIGTLEKGQQFPRVRDYGNWHQIQFGDYYGYVLKSGTKPITTHSIKNENNHYPTKGREFTVENDTVVYDNTSGKLVPYATLHKGTKATIATDYGNWWRVIIGGKVGYLLKEDVKTGFSANDKYFQVVQEDLEVYDNRSGSLKLIGTLQKGQIFPRVRDYGNWHQIQFGDYYGYVLKSGTVLSDGTGLRNENKQYPTKGREFTVEKDTVVYDNTSGKLVPYAILHKGTKATIATDYGNWWRVIIGGKVGYLLKEDVQTGFSANDKYFQVVQEDLEVYDNRSGSLKLIGTLQKGQIFPRVRDYGNWHQIQFGDYYGYVLKSGTVLSDGTGLRNENKQYPTKGREFTVEKDTVVYDNTSGKLVPYAILHKGTKATIATDYGNWWRVIIGGKVGYLLKEDVQTGFSANDKYFQVVQEDLEVYDNRSGSLKLIGTLQKGQIFPRVRDYGNWHQIQFGDYYGYVLKSGTVLSDGTGLRNENKQYPTKGREFTVENDTVVYDNTSGKLVPYATLHKGTKATIATDYGNWWRVIIGGKVGYLLKEDVKTGFSANDKYFQVVQEDLEVYDNRSGSLKLIGTLQKGQIFPRVRDYGNWHQIQFGDYYGYVLKSGTVLSDGTGLRNENKQYPTKGREFTVEKDTVVYDNTSGKLVPYATLHKGTKATIATDYGNWWRVIIGGKVGYLLKEDVQTGFSANDKYFQVVQEDLEVYDNRSGSLKLIGTLQKGQIFPRVRDYGNWHQIQFGDYYGYVLKSGTVLSDGTGLRNENKQYPTKGREFTVEKDTVVYDNTSGKLVPYATLHKGTKATIATDYGNWWRVIIGGKVGYLLKKDVVAGPFITAPEIKLYGSYSDLINSTQQKGMGTLYYGETVEVLETRNYASRVKTKSGKTGWVHSEAIDRNLADNWWFVKDSRVLRASASANSTYLGSIPTNSQVRVLDYKVTNDKQYRHWYKIRTTDNKEGWIWGAGSNGRNVIQYEPEYVNGIANHINIYTPLNSKTTFNATQLNSYLAWKTNSSSYMYNMGDAYIAAQNATGLNAIYLLAHSALETGFGTSSIVKSKYNYYGIHAFDACPSTCASEYHGKTDGIVKGADWISRNYVNRDAYKQFTLDSMRNNNNTHQYATDEAWHVKISNIAKELVDFISGKLK